MYGLGFAIVYCRIESMCWQQDAAKNAHSHAEISNIFNRNQYC
jgi:hypothetical protein